MSLGQMASSQQPSAPVIPAAVVANATPSADAQPQTSAPAHDATGTPVPQNTGMGSNSEPAGGPDWRALMAGEDTKALEAISRYKSPTEFTKAFLEQRTALSKRAEPVKLADNATPEQIAEYRKGLGVPEVASDAPAEKVMEAYGIKAPEGYEMSEVEKGMLADYAKLAYSEGHSPREVKAATNFFFKQQQASMQALNKIDVTKQKEWTSALRDELGRDYEPMVAAADTFIKKHFEGRDEDLASVMNARLPSGGRLGDNADFIRLMSDLAVKNGFTDRIEANALESGGKSLEQQQLELEALRWTNKELYDSPKTQANLERIIDLRLTRGEIDESGNPIRKRRAG